MNAVLRLVPDLRPPPDHGETGRALSAIAQVARMVDRGQPIPDADDLAIQAAVLHFDAIGTWGPCGDALMVRALERGVESGRSLHPIDRGRLREIVARVHDALDELDRRVGR